jgi:hypothetical protein
MSVAKHVVSHVSAALILYRAASASASKTSLLGPSEIDSGAKEAMFGLK